MASSSSAQISIDGLHFPPLRSLDDFILGSARFELPNYRDLEKWGNRVVKNLLYYQSNYFLLFAIIYILMALLNPVKIICGLAVKAMLIALFVQLFTNEGIPVNSANTLQQQRWYLLAGCLFGSYLLLCMYDAVLLTIFTLLLPFCASFVHASLRLRNIKNKLTNTMESFGPTTPMGLFLNSMNITVENILN